MGRKKPKTQSKVKENIILQIVKEKTRATQDKISPRWEHNCIYWQDLQGKFQQVHLLSLDN
jgi:hypothetical protein